MTLARVKSWFQKLPQYEKDLPILIVEGLAYTPRMALAEVERGTLVGSKLQALIESGRFGSPQEQERTLAKLRLMQILKAYPPEKPIVATLGLPGKTYTAGELLREIEAQTAVGERWIASELSTMKRVIELARR